MAPVPPHWMFFQRGMVNREMLQFDANPSLFSVALRPP